MPDKLLYISELILKHWQGRLTVEEQDVLDQWAKARPENRELLQQLMSEKWVAGEVDRFAQYDIQKSRKQLEVFLENQTVTGVSPTSRILFMRGSWFRYAAAILLIVGVFFYFHTHRQDDKKLAVADGTVIVEQDDVLPGSNKAVLTLSGGQEIMLDSSSSNVLSEKGIISDLAMISYSGNVRNTGTNTLTTPRGGQYRLKLNDGTMVWLNAASSVTYPAVFTGDRREVAITGEVYFEVAKDKNKPFYVRAGGMEVKVIGTHFNINAYPDEQAVKTSLLEGAVMINNRILKPGEAYYNGEVVKTDLDQDIAWKNGVFNFNNADIFMVMRQLSRWYNIDVEYGGKIKPRIFSGEMDKGLTLSQVIKILGETGVEFRIDGNKLIVRG